MTTLSLKSFFVLFVISFLSSSNIVDADHHEHPHFNCEEFLETYKAHFLDGNRQCTSVGNAALRGYCNVFKTCESPTGNPKLTKVTCIPGQIFNIKERKCTENYEGFDSIKCPQTDCFPQETLKIETQKTTTEASKLSDFRNPHSKNMNDHPIKNQSGGYLIPQLIVQLSLLSLTAFLF